LFQQTFFNWAFVHIFIIGNFIGLRFGLTNINASTAASPARCTPPYMKLSTLFIVLFLTAQVVGQPVQKIKQLLKDKNFVALNGYIDKPQKSNVDFGWEMLRTIVGDYQEGIIKIEENLPANDGTGGNFINNYRVYLLAGKNKIFYYKFIKTVYKNKGSEQWDKNEEVIDSLNDNAEYLSFENSFKQTYGDTLNQYDLFLTSIVYGSHCGIAGVNPEYMEQLNLLLQDNNVDIVRQWLKSANAEKQLYALKGYRILVNQGYNLSDEEKRIISIVEQKKGSVSTCSGCIYMDITFQDVVSEINTIPSEYLKPEKTSLTSVVFKKKTTQAVKTPSYLWVSIFGIVAPLLILYFVRRTKKGGV
jgi:hypothetical protein